MPSGADLEYQRMLRTAGIDPANTKGYDGAYLEQLGDTNDAALGAVKSTVDSHTTQITDLSNIKQDKSTLDVDVASKVSDVASNTRTNLNSLYANKGLSNTFTADQRINAGFGLNVSPIPRQPVVSHQNVDALTPGTEDKIGHVLATNITGDLSVSTGSNPNFAWGLNVFTTVGDAPNDGKGGSISNLIEVSIKTPVGTTINNVQGLLVDASFFGPQAGATVTQLEAMRIAAPKRKDGATAGTATNVYGLFIEGVNNSLLGSNTSFSLYVDGGISRFGGRVDVANNIHSISNTLVLNGGFVNSTSISLYADTSGKGIDAKVAGTTNSERFRVTNSLNQECLFVSGSGTVGFSKALVRTGAQAAGGAAVLPANPAGYLAVEVNGSTVTIPYYGFV